VAKRSEQEINELLAEVRAEYEDEDRAAAEEEEREAAARLVFSVRLPPEVYAAVRDMATRSHSTPSALIRQWVSERVAASDRPDDLNDAVARLRRDVEHVERLVRPA